MRIGEVLVVTGAITEQQLDEALRAQIIWGGRLGTNLIELGHVSIDVLSRALGRLHDLPAALESHFDRADRELQGRFTPDLAQQCKCIPLVRAGKRIVIAAMAPLDDKTVALIAGQLDVDRQMIVQAIAAELRIRYQLEAVYGIARSQRYVRVHGNTRPEALLKLPVVPDAAEQEPQERSHRDTLVDEVPLDLEGAPPPPPPRETRIERRYLPTLADLLAARAAKRAEASDKASARPFAIGSEVLPKIDLAVIAKQLPEALADIELSGSRDELARRAIGTVARFIPQSQSAMLLVVRGDAAVAQTMFSREGRDLPALAVPLDRAGLVAAVLRRKTITRGASGDLAPIDSLLLDQLGLQFGDLVVAPLVIGGHVFGAIVVAMTSQSALGSLDAITRATCAAYARLMRVPSSI
jgi:hypothetical protein